MSPHIHKTCPDCQQTLPGSDFGKDKHKAGGLTTYCKKCTKIRRDKFRNENREHFNEMNRTSLRRRRKEVYPLREVTKTEKSCSNCGEIKPIDQFARQPSSSDGLHSWCLDCSRFVTFVRHLKRNYDLTYIEYTDMIAEQNGICPICLRSDQKLVVDHNHSTGAVRKLLCGRCNTALGMFDENVESILRAAEYLRSYGREQCRQARLR